MKDELKHYGVKGMRWGVRRGSRRGSQHKVNHPKASELSDKELRDRINRMQMEKQYKQLTAKEKSAGRKFVEGVMVEIGKELLKDAIKKSIKGQPPKGK